MNPHACRTYLITKKGSKEVILVDPVLEHVTDYIEMLEKNEYHLAKVIDTHTHADHISGAASLRDITNCDYVMHRNAPAECANIRVRDGDSLSLLDNSSVKTIHTPGHTQDSISLVLTNAVLTGDTLFLDDGGAGRDDLPGGDPGMHWESLRKLVSLPEHLMVYPAHDYRNRKPSTLSRQTKTNPHLKIRDRKEFIRYIEDLRLGPADWMKDVLAANYACAQDPNAVWIPTDTPSCEVKGTMGTGVNEITVSSISVPELKNKLKSKNPPLLLDVREKLELFDELGHIVGIKHIPIGELSFRLSEIDKTREVVTVCHAGSRAHTAAQILKQSGFSNISVLEGGMIAWKSKN